MWLELIWWICNVLIFHQHILLIACEPLLNLMTNYLICVARKQWEALRFTRWYKLLYLAFFVPLPHFQYREDIYAHPCFQAFPKQLTYDYLSNHLCGQQAVTACILPYLFFRTWFCLCLDLIDIQGQLIFPYAKRVEQWVKTSDSRTYMCKTKLLKTKILEWFLQFHNNVLLDNGPCMC